MTLDDILVILECALAEIPVIIIVVVESLTQEVLGGQYVAQHLSTMECSPDSVDDGTLQCWPGSHHRVSG